jgi:acyl-CoA hydrolase/GNAT superfamily N-acetyltransferase
VEEIIRTYPALGAYRERIVSPDQAVALVGSGANVYLGSACATPRLLSHALEQSPNPPADVTIYHFLTNGALPSETRSPYRHVCFFIGSDERASVAAGFAEYVPVRLSQVPRLIENRRIPIDTAFIQVSPPDSSGFCSLGVSVDITAAVVRHARRVIAEINPNMPRTLGGGFVPVDRLDRIVWNDAPVIEYAHAPADEIAEHIARYIASIIEDGATLQVGLGRFPNEALKYLVDRRDLGIFSDVITDPIVDLIERGIVTGNAKSEDHGRIVASYCLGTQRLYDLIDNNPMFSFEPIEAIADIARIARQKLMVSVTQAFAVDLTGQVCADQFEGEFYGGVSTQLEFIQGAAQAEGGKPIICLAATTENGRTSRIRAQLQEGEGVAVARSNVHYVVTEYGIAYLFGRSIRERALALIEIAHPDFREELLAEAKRLGYVRPDQPLHSAPAYPVEEERHVELRNGEKVLIRPARASDAHDLQLFFHHMPLDDRFTRFFGRLRSLSFMEVQNLCNVDQASAVAFLAVTGPRENETVIGSACYYLNESTNIAEVAYMVLRDWQGSGLGSALQARLVDHAKARAIRGFKAEILATNAGMLSLARRATDHVTVDREGDTYLVTMLFEG